MFGLTVSMLALSVAIGLPPEKEQAYLELLKPVLVVKERKDATAIEHPIDILWWMKHSTLEGTDFKGELSVEKVIELQKEKGNAQLRLSPAKDSDHDWVLDGRKSKDSKEPASPPTVYGLVQDKGNGLIRLAYFVFYGFSDAEDTADSKKGDHVGDWLCVDFDVDVSDATHPKFTKAVFHNHGRQIFVDSPDDHMVFKKLGDEDKGGKHAKVWLEDGTHEMWPVPDGGEGFWGKLPTWVWTNNLLDSDDMKKKNIPVPGLANKVQNAERNACRGHEGKRVIKFENVVNVGDGSGPAAGDASRLFHEFAGKWGTKPKGLGDSPEGPAHGGNGEKMLRRKWSETDGDGGRRGKEKGWKLPKGQAD